MGKTTNIVRKTNKADRIIWEKSNSVIYAGKGDDFIRLNGYAYNVIINGEDDNDEVEVWDGTSNVKVNGGKGSDAIMVHGTNIIIDGGEGNDCIDIGGSPKSYSKGHNVRAYGGAGTDEFFIYETAKNVYVDGGAGADYFWVCGGKNIMVNGGAGKDTINVLSNSVAIKDLRAEDRLFFGKSINDEGKQLGRNTANVSSFNASWTTDGLTLRDKTHNVTLNLMGVSDISQISNVSVVTRGSLRVGDEIGRAVYKGKTTKLGKMIKTAALPKNAKIVSGKTTLNANFSGTFDLQKYVAARKDITAAGNKKKLTIKGDSRSNVIQAGNGGNTLYGGAGKDTLIGGAGVDVLCGGRGNDIIKCGKGVDKIQFYKGDGKDTIQNGAKNDILYLYNINNLKTQAKFKMSGKNLVMSFTNNKNDSLTLTNWTTGGLNKFVAGNKTYSLVKSGSKVSVK